MSTPLYPLTIVNLLNPLYKHLLNNLFDKYHNIWYTYISRHTIYGIQLVSSDVTGIDRANNRPKTGRIHYKIMGKKIFRTKKQKKLLQILANPDFRNSEIKDICRAAGISEQYYYQLRINPAFIEAVKTHCAGLCITSAPQILSKFAELGKKGQYKQGELVLKTAGIITDTPLIQQVIANFNRLGMSEAELDKRIAEYFYNKSIPAEKVNTSSQV